jgi:hypothetical protein
MSKKSELAKLIAQQKADMQASRSKQVEVEREPDEEEVEPEEKFEEGQEEL